MRHLPGSMECTLQAMGSALLRSDSWNVGLPGSSMILPLDQPSSFLSRGPTVGQTGRKPIFNPTEVRCSGNK